MINHSFIWACDSNSKSPSSGLFPSHVPTFCVSSSETPFSLHAIVFRSIPTNINKLWDSPLFSSIWLFLLFVETNKRWCCKCQVSFSQREWLSKPDYILFVCLLNANLWLCCDSCTLGEGLQQDKAFISCFENEFREVLAWYDEKYALMI